MRKIAFLSILITAVSSFSQTIEVSQSEFGQKLGLKNRDTGTMITQFMYSTIKSFDGNHFACSLADTSFKGNCTLIDKQLNVLIPYGQFSEIIISEDGNYATVAGEEYTVRLRENTYDTTTIAKHTKNWGLYDLKNKKLILPLNYGYLTKVYKDGILVFNKDGIGFLNDKFGQDGLFGIMNLKGEIICKDKYTFIGPFNKKGIALATNSNDFLDNINYIEAIAINKTGENIKPNFFIRKNPVTHSILVKGDESFNFFESPELNEFMNYKKENDSLTKVNLFNEKYRVISNRDDIAEYDDGGNETVTVRMLYEIYEKDSKIEGVLDPLPSNIKFYYNPKGSAIKSWGIFFQYQTKEVPNYNIINDKETKPVAIFYSYDSIYVSEYDSLELDYMYPGIFSQNKKVLNQNFCFDLRKKSSLYEELNKFGFICKHAPLDTVTYTYKYPCDTIENVIKVCRNCENPFGQIATKYYYQKKVGLVINETVELPPIYKYMVSVNETDFVLLDTLNVLWEYNSHTAVLKKLDYKFDRIINCWMYAEERATIQPVFLSAKNDNNKLVLYRIGKPGLPIIIDSLKIMYQQEEVDYHESLEMVINRVKNVESVFEGREDLAMFKGDTIYGYGLRNNQMYYNNTVKTFFSNYYNLNQYQFFNKPITLKKKTYNRYYYQQGMYLLEVRPKTYILSNTAIFTVNEIMIDSLIQIQPYIIYKSNDKMYIATLSGRDIKIQNKKISQSIIHVLDSAKQLELVDKYDYNTYNGYSSTYHDLYKADGIYKSVFTKKVVKSTPSNFNESLVKPLSLLVEDKERSGIMSKSFYLYNKDNMSYLCDVQEDIGIKDSTNSYIFQEIIERQYVVLDSAKSFEFISITNKNSINNGYQSVGIYKADGVIKSTNTYQNLSIQNAETYIKLQVNQDNLEVFAIYQNKLWKILCYNSVNYNQYMLLDNFTFKTYHDLRKTVYPFERKKYECSQKQDSQIFMEKLEDLSQKIIKGTAW